MMHEGGVTPSAIVDHVRLHLASSTDWDHLSGEDVTALVGLTIHALWDAGALTSPDVFERLVAQRVDAELARVRREDHARATGEVVANPIEVVHLTGDETPAEIADIVARALHRAPTTPPAAPSRAGALQRELVEVRNPFVEFHDAVLGFAHAVWRTIEPTIERILDRLVTWLDA